MATVAAPAREDQAGRPAPRPARRPFDLARLLVLAGLVVLVLLMIAPVLVIVLNAFKTPADYATNGPLAWPERVSFDGIVDFWNRVDFGEKLWNSFLISASVAVLGTLLSIVNAYALGIGKVRGRVWFLVFFLLANLIPHEALAYPLYFLSDAVGLYDTRLVVIIILTVIQSAFGTYLLASVYASFPRSLIDAAAIDGAGKWRVLWLIVVPNSRPTLAVLVTFFFIWTWNEFFLPLILLISDDNLTVPVTLGLLQGQQFMDATTTSASALLGIVPAVIFFLIFQRTLTRGIMAGGLK
jgi:raffinose/stachyose/melibiose transport system permease protein